MIADSKRGGNWFVDFKCGNIKYIVFKDKILKYEIGNIEEKNMVNRIGLKKQEFYLHFYCGNELIVVYRTKKFLATSDKSTWIEAQNYGKNLGIVSKQLDFLTPEQNRQRYFSK